MYTISIVLALQYSSCHLLAVSSVCCVHGITEFPENPLFRFCQHTSQLLRCTWSGACTVTSPQPGLVGQPSLHSDVVRAAPPTQCALAFSSLDYIPSCPKTWQGSGGR